MDVFNNNVWLIETIARAATENRWPRVDVKAGPVAPGVNGGFQGKVKSPMNKGREYDLPGVGLAGDWPGGWTQTYAQIDTEAGADGFDSDYFVQQVAGLSQIAGDLMRVDRRVIDLGWGKLKSSIANLKDTGMASASDAKAQREALLGRYVEAFRHVETGSLKEARTTLEGLAANVGSGVAGDKQATIKELIVKQLEILG